MKTITLPLEEYEALLNLSKQKPDEKLQIEHDILRVNSEFLYQKWLDCSKDLSRMEAKYKEQKENVIAALSLKRERDERIEVLKRKLKICSGFLIIIIILIVVSILR